MHWLSPVLRALSLFLSAVIPPRKVIVFCSYPAFTDNAFAVYRYILRKEVFKEYKKVWIVLDPKDAEKSHLPAGVAHDHLIVLPKRSVRAVLYYLTARYVFFTHGLYSGLPIARPNTVINLWHGMPLKRIGLMDKPGERYMDNTQVLIATSEMFQKMMAESFSRPLEQVWIVGQPRNDMMSEATDFFEKAGIDRSGYESIGLWLPTYRASMIGDIRTDGVYRDGQISFLGIEELKELDAFLVRTNRLLIVKIHPMDKLQECNFGVFSNLRIVKPQDFTSQLYPLLGATDYLLTDYSSVWIDYDILGKPIGFVMDDLKEYERSRGLTFSDPAKALPGKILGDMEALKEFIADPGKRKVLTEAQFNKFKDHKASERLLACLIEKSKEGSSR